MDLLSQHQAVLRAIFDNPEDDTARLVYADFLQENGMEDRAELIRVQCELAANMGSWNHSDQANALKTRESELLDRLQPERQSWDPHEREQTDYVRGFRKAARTILVTKSLLADPIAARWDIVQRQPEYFGATDLAVDPGLCLRPDDLALLFSLPVTRRVTTFYLDGDVREDLSHSGPGAFDLIDLVQEPAITAAGVAALARHPGARRLVSLDLRNNNLDNDVVQALVKSPYLDNLKRLQLLEGNQIRGKVWQQVIARFGEKVAG